MITRNKELVNYIAEIRDKGVRSEDVAATIREVFPKHTRSLIYKCMNSDLYGIELRKEAVEALQEKYGGKRKDTHKFKNSLKCRVPTAIYSAFTALAEKKNTTVNALIYACAEERLRTENDPDIAYKAQRAFCDERGVPMFAPKKCFACYGDVLGGDGRSVLYCASYHITSCPHCRRSFCD